MSDTNIDEIFSDLGEEITEAQGFVSSLKDVIPSGYFQLCSDDGEVLAESSLWETATGERDSLLKAVKDDGSIVSSMFNDHEWMYGAFIDDFGAVLLFTLPDISFDLTQKKSGMELLQLIIEHMSLKQDYEGQFTEKEQAVRQITMLKQQHGKLIEDNYRQYRLSQEKEKEYARKLENEIAFQTAELREKNMQLEEFSRLQSDFLANMSHELRTPMNAIIGFTGLLTETELSDEQIDYTRTISQSADSLLVLINDILDLAKIEAGKLDLEDAPYVLKDVIENVAAMFKLPAESKNVALNYEIDPKIPLAVIGDGHRLKQILVNLIGNSLKFTDKGSISILVDCGDQRGIEEGMAVRFSVKDTGIGISPDRQRAIFDKFTQADGSTTRKYGGTGLGLAICDQLVEMMGGVISIESALGEGSNFFFTLPMKVQEGPIKHVEEEAAGAGRTAEKFQIGGSILLVEDNLVNQRLASIIITKQGYDLEVAGDGLEALEQIKNNKFDAVLMDIQMPNMDGMAATKKIRELESDSSLCEQYVSLKGREKPLPIIGLTAHARKEDEKACYDAGMDGFLTKPLNKEKMLETLQAYTPTKDTD